MEKYLDLIIIDVALIVPFVLFYLFPPKKMNALYGYRTPRSKKNQGNWDFAQKYSARLFLLNPVLVLLTQAPIFFTDKIGLNTMIPLSIGQFVVYSIVVVILTESKLKAMAEE